MAPKSASGQEKAHNAEDESSDQQSGKGLQLNGSGDDGRSFTHLVSYLAIGLLGRPSRLARQVLHLGLGIIGKSPGGSFCPVRKVRGIIFAEGLVHKSYS